MKSMLIQLILDENLLMNQSNDEVNFIIKERLSYQEEKRWNHDRIAEKESLILIRKYMDSDKWL